jgi:hypothetical protein
VFVRSLWRKHVYVFAHIYVMYIHEHGMVVVLEALHSERRNEQEAQVVFCHANIHTHTHTHKSPY